MEELDLRTKKMMVVKGGQVPIGSVRVSGAKNAATKLMAAALLTQQKVTLYNFPTQLVDARYKYSFLEKIGADVRMDDKSETLEIQAETLSDEVLSNYIYPIRTTYLLAAAQLNRNGIARIPYPGGCKIGNRKYDLHIMVWKKMGCRVEEKKEYIEIRGHLKSAEIDFPISTVGGTENALICAAGIKGISIIRNAYISPEVYCLIEFLQSLGAEIQATGNSFIRVTGSPDLRGTTIRVIPDRIEALTWMIYGILSGGSIIIENIPFRFMESPFIHLKESGVDVYRNSENVYINRDCI